MTITMPTEAEIVATRVQAGMSPAAASSPPAPSQPSTGALIRENAAQDAAELDLFCEAVAEFFDCPSLAADQVRIKMRGPFLELRGMARRFNAEAARRAADPTAPGRDAAGRFSLAR